ncbi:Tat pathway signal sequence domain protein [Planctomonas sp. JC2975]|uniref:exo-rhamnogalacturonan lyase family protein n=1 Tax=Planctomonas sp. JC2975 TaxID=2729626 RepID=UPI00197BCF36|nr:Tat pathway signal sequence domain protein [Planctomonas sp. JC2975]
MNTMNETTMQQTSTAAATASTDASGAPFDGVRVHWLGDRPPGELEAAVTFGVPLPRETVASVDGLEVVDEAGAPVAAQLWPLATWPDGSLKWAGVATADARDGYRVVQASGAGSVDGSAFGSVTTAVGTDAAAQSVHVTRDADGVRVDTGAVSLLVPSSGPALLRDVRIDGREIAREARLVSVLQTTPPEEEERRDRSDFESDVTSVEVEQNGPVRAVVRVQGVHRALDGDRSWLPFTVRLYFTAGREGVRMLHSFVWDGDADRDFLAGLGLRVSVPLRAALHDRHVRIAGAEGGVFAEAVRGITGLRRDPGEAVRAAQIAGIPTPPLQEWAPTVSGRLELIPTWNDVTLSQLTPDGFTLRKRTAAGHAWVGVTAGTRADGYAYLGDIGGGVGLGVRDFWQSYPVQLDVRGAATDTGSLTAWLYSPEAEPMDMRFYHDGLGQDDFETQLEGLEITYEDYEPGFGDANGIARTHELWLRPYGATPATTVFAEHARLVADPAQLAAAPESIRSAGVFGDWSLPDRSVPEKAHLEDQLDALFAFYRDQIDHRRWYGFWNFGDIMHTYDGDRHVWRYDVGGYAWDNSELSPDLWLWYSFVRTGRKDVFRMAEAMTRHTGEVDTYHAGRFKGLGSRHNVQHWGCSAKQLRISSPAYRRFFYFLTADERTGDLLHELRDSDRTFLALDPTRKVRPDAATYRPDQHALAVGLGTDWGALAATWLTEWERSGDEWSRDRLLGTMEDIGSLPHGFLTGEALYDLSTGRFETTRDRISVSHLSAVFGLVEMCSELIALVDVPGFRDAWLQYCRLFLATDEEQLAAVGQVLHGTNLTQAHSRLLAYVANATGDEELARRVWRAFDATGEFLARGDFHDADAALHVRTVLPPEVIAPVQEADRVSTNAAAQFGLAAIQNLALVGEAIAERGTSGRAAASTAEA